MTLLRKQLHRKAKMKPRFFVFSHHPRIITLPFRQDDFHQTMYGFRIPELVHIDERLDQHRFQTNYVGHPFLADLFCHYLINKYPYDVASHRQPVNNALSGRLIVNLDKNGRNPSMANIDPIFTIIRDLLFNDRFQNKTYFIMPLVIHREGKKNSHCNLLMINLKQKTVERLEPHGAWRRRGSCNYFFERVDSVVREKFAKPLQLAYLSAAESESKFEFTGIQTVHHFQSLSKCQREKNAGFCLVWCFWLAEVRILNSRCPHHLLHPNAVQHLRVRYNVKRIAYYLLAYLQDLIFGIIAIIKKHSPTLASMIYQNRNRTDFYKKILRPNLESIQKILFKHL
jgi:hypothetical protein